MPVLIRSRSPRHPLNVYMYKNLKIKEWILRLGKIVLLDMFRNMKNKQKDNAEAATNRDKPTTSSSTRNRALNYLKSKSILQTLANYLSEVTCKHNLWQISSVLNSNNSIERKCWDWQLPEKKNVLLNKSMKGKATILCLGHSSRLTVTHKSSCSNNNVLKREGTIY